MNIFENFSLKNHNTFRVDVAARYFCEIYSESELSEILEDSRFFNISKLVVGDASNILFIHNFDGLILAPKILGRDIISETSNDVLLKVGAGENWDELVSFCVEKNWGGIENLVFIPGTVGASPVQNIAAYGQNFSDVCHEVHTISLQTGQRRVFSNEECQFSYRDSYFKNKKNDLYVITAVVLKLSKNPQINTSYFETGKTDKSNNSLVSELSSFTNAPYSIADVSQAVKNIRKRKLPNVEMVGTAGSFFKNPIVTVAKYKELKQKDELLQFYPIAHLIYEKLDEQFLEKVSHVKIPAGRILDMLGWKGKRIGEVGCFENQALAIVNYGNATGEEIYAFAKSVQADVLKKLGIELEIEVNVV